MGRIRSHGPMRLRTIWLIVCCRARTSERTARVIRFQCPAARPACALISPRRASSHAAQLRPHRPRRADVPGRSRSSRRLPASEDDEDGSPGTRKKSNPPTTRKRRKRKNGPACRRRRRDDDDEDDEPLVIRSAGAPRTEADLDEESRRRSSPGIDSWASSASLGRLLHRRRRCHARRPAWRTSSIRSPRPTSAGGCGGAPARPGAARRRRVLRYRG